MLQFSPTLQREPARRLPLAFLCYKNNNNNDADDDDDDNSDFINVLIKITEENPPAKIS